MAKLVIETVYWKSITGVTDEDMVAAVRNKLFDVRKVKGFQHQALYKNSNNEWVGVYYWDTLEDAHNSNTIMAEKDSFKKLISLIDEQSIRIEAMEELQSSGTITF